MNYKKSPPILDKVDIIPNLSYKSHQAYFNDRVLVIESLDGRLSVFANYSDTSQDWVKLIDNLEVQEGQSQLSFDLSHDLQTLIVMHRATSTVHLFKLMLMRPHTPQVLLSELKGEEFEVYFPRPDVLVKNFINTDPETGIMTQELLFIIGRSPIQKTVSVTHPVKTIHYLLKTHEAAIILEEVSKIDKKKIYHVITVNLKFETLKDPVNSKKEFKTEGEVVRLVSNYILDISSDKTIITDFSTGETSTVDIPMGVPSQKVIACESHGAIIWYDPGCKNPTVVHFVDIRSLEEFTSLDIGVVPIFKPLHSASQRKVYIQSAMGITQLGSSGSYDFKKVFETQYRIGPTNIVLTTDGELLIIHNKFNNDLSVMQTATNNTQILSRNISQNSEIIVGPNSKTFALVSNSGREITVSLYNLEKFYLESKVIINSQDDITNIHSGFKENGNKICIWTVSSGYLKGTSFSREAYVELNCKPSSKIMVPVFRNLARKFCMEEDYTKKTLYAERIRKVSRIFSQNIIKNNFVVSAVIYTLDNQEGFKEHLEDIGLEEFLKGNITLALPKGKLDCSNSLASLITAIEAAGKEEPITFGLNEVEFERLILEQPQIFVQDDLGRRLLRSTLMSKFEAPVQGELKDRQHACTTMDLGSDFFNRGNLNRVTVISKQRLFADKPQKIIDYQPYRSLLKINLTNGSKACKALFSILKQLPEEELVKYYKPLVYYKWDQIFKSALIYACLFWTTSIVGYIYLGHPADFPKLGWIYVILLALLLSFELKCLISAGLDYMKIIWNWADFSLILLNILVSLLYLVTNTNRFDEVGLTWIRVVCFVLVWGRGMTWMRVFRPMRHLILMTLQVFWDILPFLTVLTLVVIIFTFIWSAAPGLGLSGSTIAKPFYGSLFDVVMAIFGNSLPLPENQPWNQGPVMFGIIILANTMLALILANFLVAVISETYGTIAEAQDIWDLRATLSIIKDFEMFLRGINLWNKQTPQHLVTLIPVDGEEDDEDGNSPIEAAKEPFDHTLENLSFAEARYTNHLNKNNEGSINLTKFVKIANDAVYGFNYVVKLEQDKIKTKLKEYKQSTKGNFQWEFFNLNKEINRAKEAFKLAKIYAQNKDNNTALEFIPNYSIRNRLKEIEPVGRKKVNANKNKLRNRHGS